jgi:hypothetical protein
MIQLFLEILGFLGHPGFLAHPEHPAHLEYPDPGNLGFLAYPGILVHLEIPEILVPPVLPALPVYLDYPVDLSDQTSLRFQKYPENLEYPVCPETLETPEILVYPHSIPETRHYSQNPKTITNYHLYPHILLVL